MARLRGQGSPIGDSVPGSRVRPDGETVRWVTAFPTLGPEEPPFLIEHDMTGAEWGPEARAARALFRQPVGGRVRMTALELPVVDLGATAWAYRRVLGIARPGDGGPRWASRRSCCAREPRADPPVVCLQGEPGTPPLDLVRFGIRWVRTPAG